jgi:hypothetical protein
VATARLYDDWEDPGMVFSDVEVKNYNTMREAEDRLLWLIDLQNTLHNYWRICENGNAGARVWSQRARDYLPAMCGYMCVATDLPACDPADFNLEDKEYALRAQQIGDIEEFVNGLRVDSEAFIRRHVTLGRKAVVAQRWPKGAVKRSNKFLHAVKNQMDMFENWSMSLAKYSLNRDSQK